MGMRLALDAGLMLIVLAASVAKAHADAFVEKPGEGKVILLATFDHSDRYWMRSGRLVPVADYSKFSLSAFTEFGLNANTTLIGREEVSRRDELTGAYTHWAGAIGARRLLFDDGALRIAAQALVSAGSGLEGAPAHVAAAALDIRIAAAQMFTIAQRAAFIEISGGPRVVTGVGHGLRLDATFGFRPFDKWQLLLQSFNRFNEESPYGGRVRAHKVQASVLYDLSLRWTIFAGAFATLSARAERRQRGALAGVMRRF